MHLLETETFEHTFGPKAQRKRPSLKCADLEVSGEGCQDSSLTLYANISLAFYCVEFG